MSDVALEMKHVCKKFRTGENNNSLRDFVPYIARRLYRGGAISSDRTSFGLCKTFLLRFGPASLLE